jgi:hypothetical protein
VTDEQQLANERVVDTIELTIHWLDAAGAKRSGVAWRTPEGWLVETHYSYLEGILTARHPQCDRRFRMETRGRRPNVVNDWIGMLGSLASHPLM